MKILSLVLCLLLTGCATVRRHPVATGILTGAAIGIGVGVANHHSYSHCLYEGYIAYGDCPHASVGGR